MEISLIQFIFHGYFGNLKIGSTPTEVESSLGLPIKRATSANTETWRYGTTEFFFGLVGKEFICQMIFLEASGDKEDQPIIFPSQSYIQDWGINPPCNLDECKKYLSNIGVGFSLVWKDPIVIGVQDKRIRLTFNKKELLHSISLGS